jgi:Ca2+-binding EF-hand superfamily protein
MEALDADKNGKVSFAEFAAWYRKNGLAPFQLQVAANSNQQNAGLAYLAGGRPEPGIDAVSAAIFALLDKNKDGKLSRDELTAATAVLLPLDEDEDEIVTTRELVPNSSGGGANPFGIMAMNANAKPDAAAKNSVVLLLPAPGESPPDLVQRLQERYGPKSDKPAEKKLSRKDLGIDEALFAKLDANKDGVLDAQELAAFVKRAPDFEYTLKLGNEATRETNFIDLGTTRAELRLTEDDRGEGLTGVIRQQYIGQIKQADKDDKGYIDEKAANASQVFRGLFKAMDRDGDGKVTEKEVLAYLDAYREIQERAKAGCVSLVVTDRSRGLFDLLDTNRDGRLSVREMREAPKLLERFDRGRKGYLTKEDIPRTYELALRGGPTDTGGAAGILAQINKIYSPSYRSEPAGPTAGPLWFRKMDRNRDGDVSRKEFIGTDEEFRQLDTNGDGLISLEEAIAAEKARKKRAIDE